MTLVADNPVTVYTQPNCGPCVGVKAALKREGIPFELRDITLDPDAHARLVELGYTGTPVVEHAGGHFKGLDVTKIAELRVSLF